jgi:methyl-accepting chemotaxis protein
MMLLNVSLAVCALGLALLVLIARTLIRNIAKSLQTAQHVASAIAAGNFDSAIDSSQQDEIGALLRSMNTMQGSINTFVVELNLGAKACRRLSQRAARRCEIFRCLQPDGG